MSLLSLTLPLPDCGTHAGTTAGGTADAATTTALIAELHRRLAAPGMLAHPGVCRELRKLAEQLDSQLAPAGRAPGRHRAGPGTLPGPPGLPGQPAPGPDREAGAPVPDHGPDEPPAAEREPDEPDHAAPGRSGAARDRAPQGARPR